MSRTPFHYFQGSAPGANTLCPALMKVAPKHWELGIGEDFRAPHQGHLQCFSVP